MASKVWFITGAPRGLGRERALGALRRGDRVAVAARDVAALERMRDDFGDAVLPLQLDVTDRAAAAAAAAIAAAGAHFGRLGVVVNNAGYGQYGFAEELSEDGIRAQMETNFYGAVWVTQAAVPYLRQQRSGHIVQVTSTGGAVPAVDIAMYSASKFALEGLSEALTHEVKPFGVHVTIIEPGFYATGFGSASERPDAMPDYAEVHAQAAETLAQIIASASEPATTVDPLLAVVDAEQPPLRRLLGPGTFTLVKSAHDERLEKWATWNTSRSISAV
jgi:NAD(P)-dependent dehydrogenase (short-subunit alcohol dehydrogenase family)